MEFFVQAMGTKRVATKFSRLGASAIDARPIMRSVAEIIFAIEEATFEGQGRRGGGSWKRDTTDWLTRKIRNGLDPRINHATLALRKSMTVPGSAGQILEISRNSLIVGSDLPQAGPSQRERPFVKFTSSDRLKLRDTVREGLMAAWRA